MTSTLWLALLSLACALCVLFAMRTRRRAWAVAAWGGLCALALLALALMRPYDELLMLLVPPLALALWLGREGRAP